jgi:hypothetical protein
MLYLSCVQQIKEEAMSRYTYEVRMPIDKWDGDTITVEGKEYQVMDGITESFIEYEDGSKFGVSKDGSYVWYVDYR